MAKSYRFTLPVPPSANRWHRVVMGRIVKSKMAREYQERAAILALSQGVRQIRRPAQVAVEIVWYRQAKRGDTDKRGGVALDALQGVAFENDSQIADYRIRRVDGDGSPRIEVTVTELEVA